MDPEVELLRQLSESFGPAGFEREVSLKFRDYVSKFADQVTTDKLGSVVFSKKGTSERPRVMLAGHVDEVGFVVSSIEKENGFLGFSTLGGWFDQVLLAQRVIVRSKKGDFMGLIASKPPHLLKQEELNQVVKKDDMFIDVGASDASDVEKMGIRIGDPVVPFSPFTLVNEGRVALGKAFDDRVGAVIAAEVVRRLAEKGSNHPNTLYGAATVQEEVGLRGAMTSAHVIDPDAAIVLEVDIAGDIPGIKPREAPTKLGKGPSILTYDASMIPNQAFKELAIETAEAEKIPYQLSSVAKGGTDAGRIHLHKTGCPSIVISVPTRHIHSHAGMLSLSDLSNAIKLTMKLVERLDKKTVDSFTSL
jgi:endoglucanase